MPTPENPTANPVANPATANPVTANVTANLLATDIAAIALQEKALILPALDNNIAWSLGLTLRELAVARNHSIAIDIRRFGQPHQQLFFTALPGTTPDASRWIQRKSNVVARFHRSSYALGLYLQLNNTTISQKYALPEADYAAHGGAFPLHIATAGILGCITVSGLPQREDHNLVVEALCLHLHLNPQTHRLPTLP